ncbi:MAG: SDR family oxidoreductase [Proteobacteria bacterium]|nr:SDR family oxidoreductase [Pseudomonadota bacterium]
MSLQLFSLENQIVLITGSSRGLGWSMAKAVAEAGATVLLHGRDENLLKERQQYLQELGQQAEYYLFDVTNDEEVLAAFGKIREQYGRLDGLINNAGIQHRRPLTEFELEDFDRVVNTNLRASWLLSREAACLMQAQGSGSIVNIASIMGPQARNTISAYTASKAGVVGLTKALAVELGSKGIRCNGIAPGYFATEMATDLVNDSEFTAFVSGRTPMQRWGNPDELGGAAVFLLSNAASYINGIVIFVDGGMSCQV